MAVVVGELPRAAMAGLLCLHLQIGQNHLVHPSKAHLLCGLKAELMYLIPAGSIGKTILNITMVSSSYHHN